MQRFEGKYRIPSARRPGWNYAAQGRYFVTICTKGRVPYFGEIRNQIMGLSDLGCIVHEFWSQIPNHFSHVWLDEFVVMPNHIHGIIVIHENIFTVETCESHVSTLQKIFSYELRVTGNIIIARPKPGSIGSIIGQFKSSSTKQIRSMGYADFGWQPRFYDRIIRSERELLYIQKYIINNPKMWHRDRNNR